MLVRDVPAMRDSDKRVFFGKRLDSVCFYQFQIILDFDREVPGDNRTLSIRIESSITHKAAASEPGERRKIPFGHNALCLLCGRVVSRVSMDEDGTLHLGFDDHQELIIWKDDTPYESYIITSDRDEFVF